MTAPEREPRIAYFSPLNPASSGISDYSEELLPELAELAEVDAFVDGYEPSNPLLSEIVPTHDYRDYQRLVSRRSYDVNIYHMGNSALHLYIYRMLQEHPGVTVLHDLKLQHFLWEAYLSRGDQHGYLREVGYSHGPKGLQLARSLLPNSRPSAFELPSFHRVVDASLGTIVHSQYAARLINHARPNAAVAIIPQVMGIPTGVDGRLARRELGIMPDQLVVGSFGRVTPAKRIGVALTAFAELRRHHPDAVYLLVGDSGTDVGIDSLIKRLGLVTSVIRLEHVPDLAAFHNLIAACDICVNLRYPTVGETSAAALRLFALGRATIVSDVDAFSELPDECCAKVPPGSGERDALTHRMLELADDPERRQEIGQGARAVIAREHHPKTVARAYLSSLDRFLLFRSTPVAHERLMDAALRASSEMGLVCAGFSSEWPLNPYSRSVGRALDGLLPTGG